MLKLENIRIAFEQIVLEIPKMEIPEHCITLIRGVSGSGKTSVLYRLGLISEDQEYTFIYQGKDLIAQSEKEKSSFRQNHIAYLLQDNSLFDQYNVLGNLKLYAGFHHKEYTENEYLQFLNCVHLKVPFYQPVITLSGGEKQRLAIACCLCKDTDILILDEPTSFLDAENEMNVFQVLREVTDIYHKTVILASHSQKAIEIADEIYEIKDHKIYEVKHYEEKLTEKRKHTLSNESSETVCFSYIQYFFRKYLKYEVMITLISALLITCMNLLIMHTDITTAQAIQAFKSVSENQMFVTATQESTTIDTDLAPFDLKINSGYTEVYPYIPVIAEIADISFKVIPYFEKNDVKSYVSTVYRDTGVYLSSAAVQMTDSMHINPENEEIILKMIVKDGNVIEQSGALQIGGILGSNYRTSYLENDSTPFILCSYKIINDLYEQFSSEKYVGYTVFTDTFETYTVLYETLKEQGYGVNLFFDHLDEMEELIEINRSNKVILILFGNLITFILCTIMEIYYFRKRRKELLMLKNNGVQRSKMMKILISNLFLHISGAMAINAVLLLMVQGQQYLTQNVIFAIFLFVIDSGLLLCMVNKISAERILRS